MKIELEIRRDLGTERKGGRNIRGHVGAGHGRFAIGQVREDMLVALKFLCKFGTEPKHRRLYR